MTTPRNLERVMSLESALLDDDGPSGNSPELQELMNELMGESSSQDNTKAPPNVPKNQFTTVKMSATPPQPAYIQNVQRVNQFAQPTNPNPNISTPNITTQVRPTVIPPGRATAPIPARAIGPPLTGAVPVKTDIKSIIPIEKQKEVSDAVNQYMGGAIAYDRFCQILLALVGREAAYKIAESIKKDELKTGPPPTGQAPVVARPPGPPSGAPSNAPGMNPSMMNKKLSPAVTPAMGVPIKAVAPGVPNVGNPAPVNTAPPSMANLGQQGNATAQQMFNKIVATPMPVVGAPVTGANLPAAKKARPAGPPPSGIVTLPSNTGGVPAKSSVTAAMLPMGTMAQPGPAPQLQPGATPQKPKKDEGELEKIADPKAALKDGTDVTRMAGLDLKKELRLMTEDDSQDDPMDKDNDSAFINMSLLKKKISEIAQRRSLTVNEEALQFTSLALQEHLRNILEKLVKASQHRVEAQKDTFPVRVLSDPRKQLRILEQKQREEEQRRRQTELEAAKSDEKNSASAAALQAIADKFKPKLPPGATTPMTTTTPGAQPAPTPGAPQPMTRTAVLGQPVAPGQPAQPQPTQGTQLGMAALQSGPPNFTHQHLHQLQQLQSLQQQGKQLQPNQQKLLVYLRQQLHRLHEYQKLQGAFKKQDPVSHSASSLLTTYKTPPDPKKITIKDAMFLESVISPNTFQKFEVHQKRKRKFQTISLTKA